MPNPVMQEAGRKAWQTRLRNQRAAARAAATGRPPPRATKTRSKTTARKTAPKPPANELQRLEETVSEAIVALTSSLRLIKAISQNRMPG